MCAPFQCDHCWFINLCKRSPNEAMPSDAQLMCFIRRVNLEIFWSRKPSTVASTWQAIRKGKKMSEQLGLTPTPLRMGPWPLSDGVGFQICLEILKASTLPGKHVSTYSQFDTIRKIRSGYMNAMECETLHVLDTKTLKNERGQILTQFDSPTQSKLFRMFMKGCEKRMGRFVKQDLGLALPILEEMLLRLEMELLKEDISYEEKRLNVVCGAAFVVLWTGALRGGEVLLMEASELVKRRNDGVGNKMEEEELDHVVIPLMGRFKGETGERNLILVLAKKTSSGIEIRKWVDRLIALLSIEGRDKVIGPAICHMDGVVFSMRDLNQRLHTLLEAIQSEKPNLIPSSIEVSEQYNVYRSFRRGATTRAMEQKVPTAIIEMNNRCRKVQNSQGNLPRLPMTHLYMEISQVLKTKLRFSKSL